MTDYLVHDLTVSDPTGEVPTSPPAPIRPGGRMQGIQRWFAPEAPTLVFLGVLVAAVGFVLVGVAWSQIAATLNVGLQMPYLVSAGITGLALVMVGLLLINIGVKRQDGATRARQTAALTEALTQLRETVEAMRHGDR